MTDIKNKTQKARLHITGMTCATCASTVEKVLADTPGVGEAKVNLASETATVEYDNAKTGLIGLKTAIADAGYDVALHKSIFPVRGMTCATCAGRVEEACGMANGDRVLSSWVGPDSTSIRCITKVWAFVAGTPRKSRPHTFT